jgi:hypothetical protein
LSGTGLRLLRAAPRHMESSNGSVLPKAPRAACQVRPACAHRNWLDQPAHEARLPPAVLAPALRVETPPARGFGRQAGRGAKRLGARRVAAPVDEACPGVVARPRRQRARRLRAPAGSQPDARGRVEWGWGPFYTNRIYPA